MKKYIWLLSAVASLAVASCSRDKVTDSSGEVPSGPESAPESELYVAVRIYDADDTRASSIHKDYDDEYQHYEWFNKGSKDERAIIDNPDCNRVLFFNADNTFFGSSRLEKPDGSKGNIYVARKPANTSLLANPTQVLVVVNADPERLSILDDLEGNGALAAAGDGSLLTALNWLNKLEDDPENPESTAMYDGHFTMSSSIYMYDDEDDEERRTVEGVTVKENLQFFKTVEEAILPENLVQIYVERVLAKFTVRYQDGELSFAAGDAINISGATKLKVREYYKLDDGSDRDVSSNWSINLVNWGVNGIERDTYLFKTLVEAPASYPWSIGADFYSNWNEPRLHRSYWSIDNNYYTGFYPDQYREALDTDVKNRVFSATQNTIYSDDYSAADGLAEKEYTLIYRSYNAFAERADHKYSVENTYDADYLIAGQDLTTRPWLRCGTHIILTAQLLIDEFDKDVDKTAVDSNGFLSGVSDKYFSNGLYWTEEALLQQSVATLMSSLYFSDNSVSIPDVINRTEGLEELINGDADNPLDDETPLLADGNAVTVDNASEYFDLAPAFIKGGDGWVTLHLKDGVKLEANHKNGPEEITDAQLVSYIYRFTNLAKHYNEGRMYYALAVKHNIDSKNFDTGTKVSTGDYGVVRNHWYRLTLNTVLVPGTPVDDPDQPIIPNNEPDDKSLGVEIEVIPWHTVTIDVPQLQ